MVSSKSLVFLIGAAAAQSDLDFTSTSFTTGVTILWNSYIYDYPSTLTAQSSDATATTYTAACASLPSACSSYMTSCVSTKQAQACRTDLYSVTEGPVATAACTDLAYFNLLLFPELGIGAPACTPVTVEVGPETYSLNHQSVYEQKCAWEGELSALETMECEVSELGLRGQRTYTRGDLWTGVGGFPISTVVYAEATATAAPEASESDAPGETETSTEAGESTVGDENPAPTESANPDVEESEGLAHGIAVPIQFVAFAGGAAAVLAAAIGL